MLDFVRGLFSRRLPWAVLSHNYKRGQDSAAVLHLTNVYRRLFTNTDNAAMSDAMYVLSDMAIFSGAFRTTFPGPDVSDKEIWFNEGKKALFFHIMQAADMSPEALTALQRAVKEEEEFLRLQQQGSGHEPL